MKYLILIIWIGLLGCAIGSLLSANVYSQMFWISLIGGLTLALVISAAVLYLILSFIFYIRDRNER